MSDSPYYFFNNELFSNENKPFTPYNDLLIYEVLRVEQGKPLFIHDHLGRLFDGIKKVGHTISSNKTQLKRKIEQLAATSETGKGNIKLEFYYRNNKMAEIESRSFFIPTYYPTKELYSKGINCITLEEERMTPSVKASNSMLRNTTNELIKKHEVYEVLLYSSDHLTEGSRSNVFFIKNETIITAPHELVLSGVMRKNILEIIQHKKLPLKMEALSVKELSEISAAFITGTSPRVLPIRQIDDHIIQPNHPLIRLIQEELHTMIDKYITQYKTEL